MDKYRLKLAETAAEREQIHALNYATFVEEIPQHAPNPSRRLIDRFDAENEYVIAVDGAGAVVGMLALRARRPFSLDQKLRGLDDYLPPHRSLCEVRLLAVRPEYRHRCMFRDLVAHAARRCIEAGRDLAVISGTTRQLALYSHIGFEAFGPLVGSGEARYQPMYLALETFLARIGDVLDLASPAANPRPLARYLPGPVTPAEPVRAALGSAPVSHRTADFAAQVGRIRRRLCKLTGARDAAVLVGSGTLANDVIAGNIAGLGRGGVVLSNGEFGERLIDHARRAGLQFEALRRPWGAMFDAGEVSAALRKARAGWLWAAHCETSTGVLNDFGALRGVAKGAGAELLLDCISSVGTVDVDLAGVRLASCVSGKGLGGYPGLSMVLVNSDPPCRSDALPRYLDLGLWLEHDSVPFTHSSNLVAALDAALSAADWRDRIRRTARDSAWLRQELRTRGLPVLASEDIASPGVTTVELPRTAPAAEVALSLEQGGFEVAWRSTYLRERNWIQIALMGEYDPLALRELPPALAHVVRACASVRSQAA